MGVPENLDALLVKHDITQESLARIADVSPSSVVRWRQGAQMRKEPLEKICRYFGLTPDDILSENFGLAAQEHGRTALNGPTVISSGEATVPLSTVGKVHAGFLADHEEAERTLDVPASLLARHPRAQALVVEGTCMNKVVPEGLAVIYDPDIEPTNGKIAIVETEDYQALMRRWYRGGSTLMLVADSYEEWDDIVLKEDECSIKVIGTVVWVQSVTEL